MTQYKDKLAYNPKQNTDSIEGNTTTPTPVKSLNRQSNMQRAARSFFQGGPVQMKEERSTEEDSKKRDGWDDTKTGATLGPKSAAVVNHSPHRILEGHMAQRAYIKNYGEASKMYTSGRGPHGTILNNANTETHLSKTGTDYKQALKRTSLLESRKTSSGFLAKNGLAGKAKSLSNASNKLAGPLGVLGGICNIHGGISKLQDSEDGKNFTSKPDEWMQIGEGVMGTTAGLINTATTLYPNAAPLVKGATVTGSGGLAVTGAVAGAGATGFMLGRRGNEFASEHLGDYLGKNRQGKNSSWSDIAADMGTSTFEEAIKNGDCEIEAHAKGYGMTLLGSAGVTMGAGITGAAGVVEDIGEAFTGNADELLKSMGKTSKMSDMPADAGTTVREALIDRGVNDTGASIAGGAATLASSIPTAGATAILGTANLLRKGYNAVFEDEGSE